MLKKQASCSSPDLESLNVEMSFLVFFSYFLVRYNGATVSPRIVSLRFL